MTREQEHHHRQIRNANEKILADHALLEVRVIAARQSGITWNVIADALGVARQSASERFQRLPELSEAQ